MLRLASFPQRQLKGAIPDEHVFPCSNYLVGLVFDSLAEAFKNAREIQVPKHTRTHTHTHPRTHTRLLYLYRIG